MKNLTNPKEMPRNVPNISKTARIVYKLLAESKNDEMLNRLKAKLGKTKREIYQIISEL